jgi:hypothetical protein
MGADRYYSILAQRSQRFVAHAFFKTSRSYRIPETTRRRGVHVRVGRANAPVANSIRWFVVVAFLWQVVRALRAVGSPLFGTWPLSFFELALITVIPALFAFSLIRVFLALVQASYGSLNTYTLTASPWAWGFWIALALILVAQGIHGTGAVLVRLLPEVVRNGEFALQLTFIGNTLGYLLLGVGIVVVSLILLANSPGPSYAVIGAERALLFAASFVTYGYGVLYMALVAGYYIPSILGAALVSGVAVWLLTPYDVLRDPLGVLIVPGTALGGLTLIVWGLVVGGPPAWPF